MVQETLNTKKQMPIATARHPRVYPRDPEARHQISTKFEAPPHIALDPQGDPEDDESGIISMMKVSQLSGLTHM